MSKQTTFLLVDDDQDDVYMFREILEEVDSHIKLLTAVNGRQALTTLQEEVNPPGIIFLDLNMPLMDGKQCLGALKGDNRLRDIPVVMYTTSSYAKDIEETIQMGALGFITKPSHLHELKNILSHIVHNSPANLRKTLQDLSNTSHTFIVC